MFAPTSPFPSTSARVELATKLGEHIGKSLGGTGSGRVYARAADFAAAVKHGDITIALVDSAYLANAGGNYTVIAEATRGGESVHGWQLVARGGGKIAGLKDKHVLVPTNGGRETDFVLNVMLGGEVGRDYFGKIEPAPDTASALAALGLGKADATAVVPAGQSICPPAWSPCSSLACAIPGPVLVAYGAVSPAQRTRRLPPAAASFQGDATVSGFQAGDR